MIKRDGVKTAMITITLSNKVKQNDFLLLQK